MKSYISAAVILAAVVCLCADNKPASGLSETAWSEPIAVPIHYGDTAVVLSDAKGTAIVMFQSPPSNDHAITATSDVVEYRYRFRANDGTESSGHGLVYEKYKRLGDRENTVVDDGGQLNVLVGHFQVEWSEGSTKKGALYYTPEKLRMQFALSTDFDKMNLSRFSDQEQRTKR